MSVLFSTRRLIVVVVLSVISVWYFGVMARNSTPHGADRRRWEHPTLPAVP